MNELTEVLLYLIEILHQTTTADGYGPKRPRLYLIEILHQTTTCGECWQCRRQLYLIEILHQTTTQGKTACFVPSCILLKFYIKPQLKLWLKSKIEVVSY